MGKKRWRKIVAEAPDDVHAHQILAGLLGVQKQWQEAIHHYQSALRLLPVALLAADEETCWIPYFSGQCQRGCYQVQSQWCQSAHERQNRAFIADTVVTQNQNRHTFFPLLPRGTARLCLYRYRTPEVTDKFH